MAMTAVVRTEREEPRERLLSPRSRPSWLPHTTVGLIAAGLALVLPVLSIRVTDTPGWVGRYAMLPVEAAIGIPLLLALLRTSARRAAMAACGFIAVAAVSTLLSDNPAISFWGNQNWGTGCLFVLAMTGVWAIGTSTGDEGGRIVERALVIGVAVNACVALLQVLVDLQRLGAAGYGTQSTGLMGQPAQLAALLLGGLWLVSHRWVAGQHRAAMLIVLVAAALEVAGERFPLVLCLPLLVALTWRRPLRTKATLSALVAVGIVAGLVLTHAGAGRTSATARLGGDVGETARIENYAGAFHAIAARPIVGWGPARYLSATTPQRTLALERVTPDSVFVDGHNWPVHWAVTTGLVGVVLLGLWLVSAVRLGRGPLLGFAALVAIVQLLQPQDVAVTALALLALGAAGSRDAPRHVVPVLGRIVLVIAGVALAVTILLGGWLAYRSETGDLAAATDAASLLPHWPGRAEKAAVLALAREDLTQEQRIEQSKRWATEAISRDSRDPQTIEAAAYDYLFSGDLTRAADTFRSLLRFDPHSPKTLTGLGIVELQQGQFDQAVDHLTQAHAIDSNNSLTSDALDRARRALAQLPP